MSDLNDVLDGKIRAAPAEVERLSEEVKRLRSIYRCPFSGCGGVFEKSPSGPADTFTCNSCGAVVLPGRKS